MKAGADKERKEMMGMGMGWIQRGPWPHAIDKSENTKVVFRFGSSALTICIVN